MGENIEYRGVRIWITSKGVFEGGVHVANMISVYEGLTKIESYKADVVFLDENGRVDGEFLIHTLVHHIARLVLSQSFGDEFVRTLSIPVEVVVPYIHAYIMYDDRLKYLLTRYDKKGKSNKSLQNEDTLRENIMYKCFGDMMYNIMTYHLYREDRESLCNAFTGAKHNLFLQNGLSRGKRCFFLYPKITLPILNNFDLGYFGYGHFSYPYIGENDSNMGGFTTQQKRVEKQNELNLEPSEVVDFIKGLIN